MIRLALELLGVYILYKIIFDFIIPVASTTKNIKKQFGEMQTKMNEYNSRPAGPAPTNTTTSSSVNSNKRKADDYIDFEEIK